MGLTAIGVKLAKGTTISLCTFGVIGQVDCLWKELLGKRMVASPSAAFDHAQTTSANISVIAESA
jgi:hypothetical protein